MFDHVYLSSRSSQLSRMILVGIASALVTSCNHLSTVATTQTKPNQHEVQQHERTLFRSETIDGSARETFLVTEDAPETHGVWWDDFDAWQDELRKEVQRHNEMVRKEFSTIPNRYRTITETVVVQPASTETVTIPATFETVDEIVVVQAATTQNVCEAENSSVCREVEVPPVTKTVTRRIVKQTGGTRERTIPQSTKEVTRRVLVRPPIKEIPVPRGKPDPLNYIETVETRKDGGTRKLWDMMPDNRLPVFRPPETSLKYDLPAGWANSSSASETNLADIMNLLLSEVEKAGESQSNVRVLRYRAGFTLLLPEERIDENGITKKNPSGLIEREMGKSNDASWKIIPSPLQKPAEKRMRRIALVITTKGYIASEEPFRNGTELEKSYNDAGTLAALPNQVLEQFVFSDAYRIQVRIYERRRETEGPRLMKTSFSNRTVSSDGLDLSLDQHRRGSALLSSLDNFSE